MWCLGRWLSGRVGSAWLTVELGGRGGHFQPEWFNEYMVL